MLTERGLAFKEKIRRMGYPVVECHPALRKMCGAFPANTGTSRGF
jgi:predicted nuclease with RNAse H fold